MRAESRVGGRPAGQRVAIRGRRALEPSSFGINTVERDGATVLIVVGEVDLATAPALDDKLRAATADCDGPVIVDLDRVSFMDSSGLQVLVSHTLSSQNGCEVLLTRGSPQVQRLFEVSGMLEHLPFAP